MARDAQNQAKNTYQQSADLTSSSQQNKDNLYNTLVPQFTGEATNPQGYGEQDLADMNTAAQQTAGGSTAAAVGEAGQLAASNRNFGGFAPALDEATRQAGRTLTQANLGIKGKNADLKQQQRQEGLAGLSGLEGQENSDVLSSLGLQDTSTNALTNAGNNGWFQNALGLVNTLKGNKPTV